MTRRWLLLACLLGCNNSSERDAPPTPTVTLHPADPGSASSLASSARATAAVSAQAASASAATAAPGDLAGAWAGSYEAKKGDVLLPPKVKDKALAADDGKAAAGHGSVELTFGPGSEVHGKLSGALGAGTISGRVEGSTLRASIRPDDLQAPNAMSGVLMGERRGDAFACDLRVAGPDATVIRVATFELKRKP